VQRFARAGAVLWIAALGTTGVAVAHAAKTPQQRQMESIVRTWSRRLNAGDNDGIARLFAVPATIVQAPYKYRFPTRKAIAAWHAGLPCAGHIVRITFRRNTATAVFRLANRGSTPCDGPGALVAARFTIVKGLITVWEQVPVPVGAAA
jgi:hypothetical protein